MKLIILSNGLSTKVDSKDFEQFFKITFHAKWNAHTKSFYARRRNPKFSGIRPKLPFLHREIMGNPVGMEVDHKNHDTLDNRRRNLRVCSRSQNQMNLLGPRINPKKGTIKSGLRGVSWHKRSGKWIANIRVNGKYLYLGTFVEKRLAYNAYKKANKKYFGMFGGL